MILTFPKVLRVLVFAGAALVARADVVPGWLLVQKDLKATIVCSSAPERDALVAAGWKVEVEAGLRTDGGAGTGPLHRLARATKTGTERLLETDVTKLPELEKAGFADEGVVGYVADSEGAGRAAVIQYAKGERKLWLVTAETQAEAEKAGWKKQGLHFWLFAAPATEK